MARFVRDAVSRHQGPADAAPELLAGALRDVAGLDVPVPEPDLRRLLDPRHFVETRVTEGSVHPREVLAHVAAAERDLAARAEWHADRVAHVGRAVDGLVARTRALATGGTRA